MTTCHMVHVECLRISRYTCTYMYMYIVRVHAQVCIAQLHRVLKLHVHGCKYMYNSRVGVVTLEMSVCAGTIRGQERCTCTCV